MLSPDERSVLLDALRPDPGAQLDAAVATTFTVDFAAALVPPLAFARQELTRTEDALAALQAVRQCSDRIDVFHQGGQLAVPLRASRLVAYLEPMLHAVRRPTPGTLFHPKVWFLRYRDPDIGEETYRLLCSTRNLTQDRSWDALVRLDGRRRGRASAGNRPLVELLRSLPGRCVTALPAERVARVNQLAEDARHIEWDLPADVADIAFHLITGARSAVPDFSGRRHLVVSPFLTDEGLQIVAPSSRVTVVSRPESFDGLDPETAASIERRILISMPALVDDDAPSADGKGSDVVPFGLHAKIVIVERGHRAHVFVGSANATEPAFTGNVEFVVELTGSRSKLGIDATFDGGLATYLEEYPGTDGLDPDPKDEVRRRLEMVLREMAEAQWRATVTANGDAWTVSVSTAAPIHLDDGMRGTAELLTSPGRALPLHDGAKDHGAVAAVALADVTPFLAIRLDLAGVGAATVVRAHLDGDPPGRLDAILASQVDTPEKFLRFLALLLGLDTGAGFPEADQVGEGTGAAFGVLGPGGGVLEAVLRALADSPRSVADLDRLVQGLARTEGGRAVLPDGFAELWKTVMAAHGRLAVEGATA